jgi:hypothetical protein
MQHGEEAEFHAQTFRIAGNGEQGLGGGAEEDIVDQFFVVEGDGGDGFGEREDHVKILGGQQLSAALLQPLFACQALALGAMAVAARAISRVLMQGQGVRLPVGGSVLSKDVGQLQGWLGHQLFLERLVLADLDLAGWSS